MFTQLLAGTGTPLLLTAAVLIGAFLALLTVCGNNIAGNDEKRAAAAQAETYCHLTWFEVFRYLLAVRFNVAKVAR